MKIKTISALTLIATALFLVACAAQTPEERAAKFIEKGDAKMTQAMGELRDADNAYIAFDSKDALKSFNKAVDHIDDAVVFYAKAYTSPDEKGAVSALEDGLNELEKCIKAIQGNDSARALQDYRKAQSYFDKAEAELWGTR